MPRRRPVRAWSRLMRSRCGTAPPPALLFAALRDRNVRVGLYGAAIAISVLGLSYAAVPLYQLFCQATGYGGTTQQADADKFKSVRPVEGARQLTIFFNADTTDTMPWTFKPQQAAVKVRRERCAAGCAARYRLPAAALPRRWCRVRRPSRSTLPTTPATAPSQACPPTM